MMTVSFLVYSCNDTTFSIFVSSNILCCSLAGEYMFNKYGAEQMQLVQVDQGAKAPPLHVTVHERGDNGDILISIDRKGGVYR